MSTYIPLPIAEAKIISVSQVTTQERPARGAASPLQSSEITPPRSVRSCFGTGFEQLRAGRTHLFAKGHGSRLDFADEAFVPVPPKVDSLVLASIADGHPAMSPAKANDLVEAAAVCLRENGHRSGVRLTVSGVQESKPPLVFRAPTRQAMRTHADLQEAVELGATAVTIALITRVTDYRVVLRSRKGTGFDYWLGEKEGVFQARLEISGILKGPRRIHGRIREKLKQMAPSDHRGLPGYAAVVEFSTPEARIEQKP